MDFIANTPAEIEEMLKVIGVRSIDELFGVIPEKLRASKSKLPAGMSEAEVIKLLEAHAARNKTVKEYSSFLGGGAYEHHIPSVVDALVSRSEFYTAYTPYQPEVSQGMLQSIFEYQTLICELAKMDVSNASLYDGATALAEAIIVSLNSTRLNRIVVSEAVNPQYKQVLMTFLQGRPVEIIGIPADKDGAVNSEELKKYVDEKSACVVVQSPNFFGVIEPLEKIAGFKNTTKKTQFIVAVDPISLGILKPPGEFGADIVVGEGQALGSPLNYGGPYLGFMAVKSSLAWKMPGRIVGMTKDKHNKDSFVLTLQTREQHIKRERASSNICSNQALNALAAAVYMGALGKQGIVEVSRRCASACNYLLGRIKELEGYKLVYPRSAHFNEFVLATDGDINKILKSLLSKKILGGIKLDKYYPDSGNKLLVAVTETKSKDDLDNFVRALKEAR